jgi:hypothetical protein
VEAHWVVRCRGSHKRLTDGGEVVSLTHRRSVPVRKIPGTHLCYRLSRPQSQSEAGRIRPTEKYSDIGTGTRDLTASGIVPQPTMLPRASVTLI